MTLEIIQCNHWVKNKYANKKFEQYLLKPIKKQYCLTFIEYIFKYPTEMNDKSA